MFGALFEKRIQYFKGFFDETEINGTRNFIKRGDSSLFPGNYNSLELYGMAMKKEDGRGAKKKIVFIYKNHWFYLSKFLGITKFIKYVDLRFVYAIHDEVQDLRVEKDEYSGGNIVLFKNSKYLKFTFKDQKVFEKFKQHVTVNCLQVNFVYKYSLKNFLSSGGFAEVSIVHNRFTEGSSAAKIFSLKDMGSDNHQDKIFQRELIKNEITMLRHLRGEFISNLEEIHEVNDKLILVMERLNQNLGSYVQTLRRELNQKELKSFMKQTLQALSFIHDKGVIHRDIKLDNIMLCSQKKKIKIIDFGLSTFVEDDNDFRHRTCGTYQYIAPEVKDGNYYDTKVDIYSLGVTFYLLVTGNKNGKLSSDELRILEKAHYSPPICLVPLIEPAGLDLLQKMLRRDPFLRVSAREALQHEWFRKKTCLLKGIEPDLKMKNEIIDERDTTPSENMLKFTSMCFKIQAFDLQSKKPFEKNEE